MTVIFRDKNGNLVSSGNSPGGDSTAVADAAYNWGTAAATLGQRPRFIQLPATAPRILTMPAVDLCAGWEVFVTSTGASTIQVNGPGAIGGTIAAGATGHFWCDGITWHAFGEAPAS